MFTLKKVRIGSRVPTVPFKRLLSTASTNLILRADLKSMTAVCLFLFPFHSFSHLLEVVYIPFTSV